MAISNAVYSNAVARVTGYALTPRDFSEGTDRLPQRITIFTVIEQSKQAGFSQWGERFTLSSVSEVLNLFGICPAYYLMRILKPVNGGGVGGIPIDIYPILETTGVKANGTLTVTGTATKTTNHAVIFNGRGTIDSQQAVFTIEKDDTPTEIRPKIKAAIDAMISSSVDTSDGVGAGDI